MRRIEKINDVPDHLFSAITLSYTVTQIKKAEK
ncbi:MAG: hypothetical protein ACI9RV_000593, partial [Glaciecola sp.]